MCTFVLSSPGNFTGYVGRAVLQISICPYMTTAELKYERVSLKEKANKCLLFDPLEYRVY